MKRNSILRKVASATPSTNFPSLHWHPSLLRCLGAVFLMALAGMAPVSAAPEESDTASSFRLPESYWTYLQLQEKQWNLERDIEMYRELTHYTDDFEDLGGCLASLETDILIRERVAAFYLLALRLAQPMGEITYDEIRQIGKELKPVVTHLKESAEGPLRYHYLEYWFPKAAAEAPGIQAIDRPTSSLIAQSANPRVKKVPIRWTEELPNLTALLAADRYLRACRQGTGLPDPERLAQTLTRDEAPRLDMAAGFVRELGELALLIQCRDWLRESGQDPWKWMKANSGKTESDFDDYFRDLRERALFEGRGMKKELEVALKSLQADAKATPLQFATFLRHTPEEFSKRGVKYSPTYGRFNASLKNIHRHPAGEMLESWIGFRLCYGDELNPWSVEPRAFADVLFNLGLKHSELARSGGNYDAGPVRITYGGVPVEKSFAVVNRAKVVAFEEAVADRMPKRPKCVTLALERTMSVDPSVPLPPEAFEKVVVSFAGEKPRQFSQTSIPLESNPEPISAVTLDNTSDATEPKVEELPPSLPSPNWENTLVVPVYARIGKEKTARLYLPNKGGFEAMPYPNVIVRGPRCERNIPAPTRDLVARMDDMWRPVFWRTHEAEDFSALHWQQWIREWRLSSGERKAILQGGASEAERRRLQDRVFAPHLAKLATMKSRADGIRFVGLVMPVTVMETETGLCAPFENHRLVIGAPRETSHAGWEWPLGSLEPRHFQIENVSQWTNNSRGFHSWNVSSEDEKIRILRELSDPGNIQSPFKHGICRILAEVIPTGKTSGGEDISTVYFKVHQLDLYTRGGTRLGGFETAQLAFAKRHRAGHALGAR